ncbi:MAG: serine/threonine protein kinase [Deltaproteobacteria bacterium]|nr:serine/threonine protein kinase [Deltaproteobacteria bacterium]
MSSPCQFCGAVSEVGEFRVLRKLAESERGRVYLAQQPDGKRVAIKELVFATVPGIQALECFQREADVLKQLRHPRIPRFLASLQIGEGVHTRLYLVQEFQEGTSLLEELKNHRFSEEEVTAVARHVLPILAYLHNLSPPLVHRDVKPANLIRLPDGSIALVDFDSARDLPQGRTHRSSLVGTFGYMPPEQLGGTVDATADLYALGATLLHLLSRRPPEEMLGPGMSIDLEGRSSLSPRMREFLGRLLAPSPASRFPSATEALLHLDTDAGRHAGSTFSAEHRPASRNPPSTHERTSFPREEDETILGPGGRWFAALFGPPLAAVAAVSLVDESQTRDLLYRGALAGALGVLMVWAAASEFGRWIRRLAYSAFGAAFLLAPVGNYLLDLSARRSTAELGFPGWGPYELHPVRLGVSLVLGLPLLLGAVKAWLEPKAPHP